MLFAYNIIKIITTEHCSKMVTMYLFIIFHYYYELILWAGVGGDALHVSFRLRNYRSSASVELIPYSCPCHRFCEITQH